MDPRRDRGVLGALGTFRHLIFFENVIFILPTTQN